MGTVSTYNGDVIQDDEEVMGSLHQLVSYQDTHLERERERRNCKTAFRNRYLHSEVFVQVPVTFALCVMS